jgi:hypothetical protein
MYNGIRSSIPNSNYIVIIKSFTGEAEWVSGDEIKNISEEEAGFEDASEDSFDDEDPGEDEIKNISEEEAGFEDASEDAFDDQDTVEDVIKNISEEEAGFEDTSEDAFADVEPVRVKTMMTART